MLPKTRSTRITNVIHNTTSIVVSVTFLDGEGVSLVPPVVKKTAAKGGYNVKSLAEGIYKFKLTKVGYVEQLINVTVNSDELCNIKAEMNKI